MSDLKLQFLLALGGLFTGVAMAGPDTPLLVDTATGEVLALPIRDITAPAALLVAGGMLGRLANQLAAALKDWRPHIVVEHRHVQAPPSTPPRDAP